MSGNSEGLRSSTFIYFALSFSPQEMRRDEKTLSLADRTVASAQEGAAQRWATLSPLHHV